MRWLAIAAMATALSLSPSLTGIGVGTSDASTRPSTIAPPACTSTSAPIGNGRQIGPPLTQVPGQPYGLAISSDGRDAFATTDDPATLHSYTLTSTGVVPEGQNWWTTSLGEPVSRSQPSGLALTPNDHHLVVAIGAGAAVFSVDKEGTAAAPTLKLDGVLASPEGQPLEVALSRDGQFVFLSDHESNKLAVFSLRHALASGFGPNDLVGTIPLGMLPGGMSLSPDGCYLYVVSEHRSSVAAYGSLTTLSVKELESHPARSVVSAVDSGCGSVRVAATASTVYVTARDANSLLSFSAGALLHDPRRALVGILDVGTGPIGLGLVDHQKGLVVADSRGGVGGGLLAVLSTERPADPTILGYIKSGAYPRELRVSPNDFWLLASDWGSNQIQAVPISSLLTTWPHL